MAMETTTTINDSEERRSYSHGLLGVSSIPRTFGDKQKESEVRWKWRRRIRLVLVGFTRSA